MEPDTISKVEVGYSLDSSLTKYSGQPHGVSKENTMVLKSESSLDLPI